MSDVEALCASCEIRTLAPDKAAICATLAAESVRQWWVGNPTLELREVAGDVISHSGLRPQLDLKDSEALYNCLGEHSSGRDEALNPF